MDIKKSTERSIALLLKHEILKKLVTLIQSLNKKLLGSFTTQNILGRKLPKVTLVGNAIPPNNYHGW